MIPTFVYSEITPNPDAMKFVADRLMVTGTYEFNDPDEVTGIPLLEKLFNFPFVTGLFISGNFISVTKNNLVEWGDVSGELREFIQNFLKENQWVIDDVKKSLEEMEQAAEQGDGQQLEDIEEQFSREDLNEVELKIVDLLDEYVRPAVEQDGGAIVFKNFEPEVGKLTVQMKGACNGCPSSTVTLKSGIEQLFHRMMPEVKEVVSEG